MENVNYVSKFHGEIYLDFNTETHQFSTDQVFSSANRPCGDPAPVLQSQHDAQIYFHVRQTTAVS